MRVSDGYGMETEVLGPAAMDRLGEVWVLNGRLISVTDLWSQYVPQPERRLAERRSGERRANRTRTRRRVCRRIRDAVNRDAWRTICERLPRPQRVR
jgi:hypothetical protein